MFSSKVLKHAMLRVQIIFHRNFTKPYRLFIPPSSPSSIRTSISSSISHPLYSFQIHYAFSCNSINLYLMFDMIFLFETSPVGMAYK